MQNRLLICLVFLFFHGLALAAPPTPVLRDLAVLEDPPGSETIETIAAADPARFKPLDGSSFAGGYTRSTHWFRLTVEAPAGEWWLEVLPSIIDDLRLYEPDPKRPGRFLERRQGDALPFSAREVDYRGFVFKRKQAEPGRQTLYLRMQTSSSSLMLLRLWLPQDFHGEMRLEYGLLMSSIVIILTVLLLNINSWFWLRDPLTVRFVVYLFFMAALFAGNAGFLHQYLYPGSAIANNWVVGFVSLVLVASGNWFCQLLFLVERDQVIRFLIYRAMFWAPLLGLVPALNGYYPEVMQLITATVLPMTLLGIILAIRLWRRGAPGGGMMLLANLVSMVGITVFVLYLRGHVSGGFLMLHSLQIASMGNILALQLAVGARYRSLHDERVKAENDATREHHMRVQQGRFLAMLAHELRTSLSVLKMAVGRQPMSPKALASAERAMAGMSDVIERSIEAEKLGDGGVQLEQQPCDVAEMLSGLIADSAAAGRFRFAAAGRLTRVTDAKLLRVILGNLVDNAAKYAAPGTPIDIAVSQAGDFRVRVTNAVGAAGLPDPDRIFEKYYRAPQAHQFTGSGLGLYIARGMAERLGATLACLPGPEQVSFELRFPAAR